MGHVLGTSNNKDMSNMWKTSNTIHLEIVHCQISMQEVILKILPRDDSATFITTYIFMEQVL